MSSDLLIQMTYDLLSEAMSRLKGVSGDNEESISKRAAFQVEVDKHMDTLMKLQTLKAAMAPAPPTVVYEEPFNPSIADLEADGLYLDYEDHTAAPINFVRLRHVFVAFCSSKGVPKSQWIRIFSQTYKRKGQAQWIFDEIFTLPES